MCTCRTSCSSHITQTSEVESAGNSPDFDLDSDTWALQKSIHSSTLWARLCSARLSTQWSGFVNCQCPSQGRFVLRVVCNAAPAALMSKITDDSFGSLSGMTHRSVTHRISPAERDCAYVQRPLIRAAYIWTSSASNFTPIPLFQRKEERRAKQVPKGEGTGEGHSSGCATMARKCVCVCISANRRKVYIGQRGRACPHR